MKSDKPVLNGNYQTLLNQIVNYMMKGWTEMTELNDLLKHIAKAMVDYPEQVEISEVEGSHATILGLKVAKSDLGMVIGKQGKNANAIRTLIQAASAKTRKRVTVDILE